MPKGRKSDRPTTKYTVRLAIEDVEALKRFYPQGYNFPLQKLVQQHVRALEARAKKKMEKSGLSSRDIESAS